MNIVTREGHNHLVPVGREELKLWGKTYLFSAATIHFVTDENAKHVRDDTLNVSSLTCFAISSVTK